MSTLFNFSIRLFLCFMAAKLILLAVGLAGRDYLVGLTVLFLANVYLFQILALRDRFPSRRSPEGRADGKAAPTGGSGSANSSSSE